MRWDEVKNATRDVTFSFSRLASISSRASARDGPGISESRRRTPASPRFHKLLWVVWFLLQGCHKLGRQEKRHAEADFGERTDTVKCALRVCSIQERLRQVKEGFCASFCPSLLAREKSSFLAAGPSSDAAMASRRTSLSRPLRCAELKDLCGHALELPAPHKAIPFLVSSSAWGQVPE